MPKKNGFTLIELLITIAIIAVLSAIGMVVYTSVLRQGRDSKRQSDLRSIQSALEQYQLDMGFYPSADGADGLNTDLGNPASLDFTNETGNPSLPSSVKTYMNLLPKDPSDPTGVSRYKYVANPTTPSPCDNLSATTRCTSYCLYTKIENLSTNDFKTCPALSPNYNFALTPP